MTKLNMYTVEVLLATFADQVQGASRTDEDYLSRRLKEVREFLEHNKDLIMLMDAALDEEAAKNVEA